MAVENYASKENLSEIFTKVETKLSNRYTKAQVDSAIANAIAGVTEFDYQAVSQLPATGVKGVVYLVPNSGSGSNRFNEYIWISIDGEEPAFELFGSRELDISGKLENSDVKVDTTSLTKTNDASGNGFTIDLSAGTKASLAKADTAVQPDDIDEFLVGGDVKVDGTSITKTTDAEGNGFTIDLSAASKASLAKAESALQPGDVEPLSTADVTALKAIFTDD